MKYKNFYTVTQTADHLRCSENTIYRMARRGDLDGVKVGRQWRFSHDAIEKMDQKQKKSKKY